VFKSLFMSDPEVTIYNVAIGPEQVDSKMHLSANDDSSSLLPITQLQNEIFPGTSEIGEVAIRVAPLNLILDEPDIVAPAMLKLDVQGYELDALHGCETLMRRFKWIYCECSFVELYEGQSLAYDVIAWLNNRNYKVVGVYNSFYDDNGRAIQADFLFANV